IPEFLISENLENRLLWKTIVIQKGLFELSAFWKLGGLWRAFLCFWRPLTVKRLLHLDFFLVQQPLFWLPPLGEAVTEGD
ncbi:hypothetical protein, partial [Gemmiger sp.]|uniref:hypothetical protein n=1 Tax=Gemmiger sp. TaxID=2049027 RepID=UPI003A959999